MKKHHELKILPIYFEYVIEGRKTFEIRKNDRGFLNADIVTLREWDSKTKEYTGQFAQFEIGTVLPLNMIIGVETDYVVFSLLPVSE